MAIKQGIRRRFLQKSMYVLAGVCSSLFAFARWNSGAGFVFQVTMIYKEQNLDLDVRPWENTNSFADINSRYFKDGKILSLKKTVVKNNTVIWTYVFDSEETFAAWDREVIATNTFQAQLIPSSVEYKFETKKYS